LPHPGGGGGNALVPEKTQPKEKITCD
jgi:hypothetical protein